MLLQDIVGSPAFAHKGGEPQVSFSWFGSAPQQCRSSGGCPCRGWQKTAALPHLACQQRDRAVPRVELRLRRSLAPKTSIRSRLANAWPATRA